MAGQIYDIGGPDILTYREMMMRFAKILGLKRKMIVVPVLTPRLVGLLGESGDTDSGGSGFSAGGGFEVGDGVRGRADQGGYEFEPIGFDKAVSWRWSGRG